MKAFALFIFFVSATAHANSDILLKYAGRASSWKQAYEKCESLGGRWTLPTHKDLLALVGEKRVRPLSHGGTLVYPMWIRDAYFSNFNAFGGDTDVFYVGDAEGHDAGILNVSTAELEAFKMHVQWVRDNYEEAVEMRSKEMIDAILAEGEAKIQAMDQGFEVRCVRHL